jgi:Ca-activated chloride channel homolog
MRIGAALQVLGFFVLVSSAGAAGKPLLPTLTIATDDGQHALELVAVRVDTIIRGHLARTECELTYRNDLDREVEGEFSFPLPAGAELTGLGLYFNGRLRQAVAVERERARVAYEWTVHQRIDPALAEWSTGNRATLHVYPIPAKGEKKVWLSYDQEIVSSDYVLDLRWGSRLRSADIRIDADGRFIRDGRDVSYERPYRLQLSNTALDRILTAEADARTEVLAVRDDATHHWYLAAAPRVTSPGGSVPPARDLVVFWDTSGSAMHQNSAALLEFINLLAARQNAGARISFIPFDATVGDAVATVDGLHAIGATNYPALFARMRRMMAEAPADTRFLLVTDGITSLGSRREIVRAAGELRSLNRPLTVIHSSPRVDEILLTQIAGATKGWLLDLSQLMPVDAAEAAMRFPPRTPLSAEAIPIAVSTRIAQRGERIALAAELEFKPFILPVRFGDETRSLPIRELREPREIAMVRSAYARAKLRELLLSDATDAEILEHGQHFQQMTPRTSLIVLDSWRDYERWDAPMPDDVRREKAAYLKAQELEQRSYNETRPAVIQPPPPSAAPQSGGAWEINGVTTTGGDVVPGVTVTLSAGNETHTLVSDSNGHVRFRLDRAPSNFTMRAELSGLSTLNMQGRRRVPSGSTVQMDLHFAAITETITVTAESPMIDSTRSGVATSFISGGQPVDDALVAGLFADPDSEEVLARRRQTLDAVAAKMATIGSVEERVRYYLAARATFGGDKAFHLQAATLFHEDAPQLAVRILSELAEAYPDDSALLRILARILDGWNDSELARLLLQHAIEVAAGEPQTWRELVLLEARLGNDDAIEQITTAAAAIDPLVRDGIVKEITPLLTRWRSLAPGTSHDLRLEDDAALQVDLMWDTNFSDVDLYVTEPGGEQVMYQHKTSAQGGRLHADITTGYGPEIYTIARPVPGSYEIAVDYYATDQTDIDIETLVHAVVHQRTRSGVDRREFILLLTKGKEHRSVTTIAVDGR